jgi:hypothetical protein
MRGQCPQPTWTQGAPKKMKRRKARRFLLRGCQKQIDGPPRAFAISQTHPPTSRFLFLGIFLNTFSGVSRQGELENTTKMFLQKVHVKNFFRINRQKF